MNIEKLCYKTDIHNFVSLKKEILKSISLLPKIELIDAYQKISNTDFSSTYHKPYAQLIIPSFEKHIKKLNKKFDYCFSDIKQIWFQQYKKNDYHGWHCHADATFTHIAYIELPNKEAKTLVKFKGKTYNLKIKEGQIMSMPGFLIHCSPLNYGKRKTVIVVNSWHHVYL